MNELTIKINVMEWWQSDTVSILMTQTFKLQQYKTMTQCTRTSPTLALRRTGASGRNVGKISFFAIKLSTREQSASFHELVHGLTCSKVCGGIIRTTYMNAQVWHMTHTLAYIDSSVRQYFTHPSHTSHRTVIHNVIQVSYGSLHCVVSCY